MFLYIAFTVLLIILAFIVLLNNPKSWTNRFYSLTGFAGAWWVIANYFSLSDSQSVALFFSRQITPASVVGCYFFYCVAESFPEVAFSRRKLLIASIPAIIIILLAGTSLNFSTREVGGELVYSFGALYVPYVITMAAYIIYGVVILFTRFRKSSGMEKQRILFVLFGLVLTAIPPIILGAVLPALGVDTYSDYSAFFVLAFMGFTGYSILRHKLFNIRAVVARSLAYVFSIGAFSLLYAFLAFGLAQGVLLKNILTTENSREIFNVVLAVILAFTFPAIRRFFERATDRVFYRDRYDPQQLVSDIGRVLASEILLERLSKKVLSILSAQMHLENSNIVVISDGELFYQTHSNKTNHIFQAVDLVPYRKGVTITDELMGGDKRAVLDRHSVRAVFPLRTTEAFVGYLLLGDKRSGDIFSSQDVQTLTIIANELAIAINNARSYQEIQRFNETLREKVRRATVDLRHANTELKELDKAKDEFISMASHQLRTPLTAVRGYTSMVMDGDFGRISKSQQETLQQAFDAATRMTRLVDDLLNVSRIQSGKFKIERTEVDLNKIIPEEISLLATAAEMKHVAMEFHTPKKPVPVLQIDEGKTRQCLMNLMDNAIYYSSTVESGGKVDIHLEADTDWVSFWVVDNGIGVPKAEQAKLFQKFYRAPNAQKTRPDGTGLGLFLVGRVTKDQGGEVIFESEEGKGSTFGFKLPIKSAGEGIGR